MKYIKSHALYIAWTVSVLSVLGSLYFSEVLHYAPCVLCWFQRICSYPLVLILGAGILRRDRNVIFYALPLSFLGLLIAGYHNLLYWQIIPESLSPCVVGVSCLTKYINYFGFISIPFLSFISFLVIVGCLWLYTKTDIKGA